MKTEHITGILGLLILGMIVAVNLLTAEEAEEGTYATVVKAEAGKLVVSEYDLDKEDLVDITYQVDPRVKLVNFKALTELQKGTGVDLVYVLRNGKKVVTEITMEPQGNDDDTEGAGEDAEEDTESSGDGQSE